MLDLKAWLDEATGEPVYETTAPPSSDRYELPCVVFIDVVERSGSDDQNMITYHTLTIERYSEDGAKNAGLEAALDEKGLHYNREPLWISDDEMYEEVYQLLTDIIERSDINA